MRIAVISDIHGNRHAFQAAVGPKTQRDLVPVEAWNVQVDQHEIGPLRERQTHAFEAVGRFDDVHAVGDEELSDEQTIARIVFDMQDARHGSLHLS